MRVLSVALSLVFAAGLIQAGGIDCGSICAACWKIGSTTGEDTKLSCDSFGGCPDECPTGYDRMHCAKQSRCKCAVPDCADFGPCACGVVMSSGRLGNWKTCKPPSGSGAC